MPGKVFYAYHAPLHDAHCRIHRPSNDCKAVITGENLGQVASQTMEAMAPPRR